MKLKSIILLIFVSIVFSGCNKQKVQFMQIHTFNNGIWPRLDHVDFQVPVKPSNTYDMLLEINYDPNIILDVLPLHIIITSDDGEERIREHRIRLKDAFEFRGEMQDNGTLVISEVIRSNLKVDTPTEYNIDIECFYYKYEIPFINSLTLKLVKTSPKKSNK